MIIKGVPGARASLLGVFTAATLAAAAGTACTRESAPAGRTLDDLKPLIEVTDRTVSLARSLSKGTADAAGVQRQILALISAVQSSGGLIGGPSRRSQIWDRLDSFEYADVGACVETHTTLLASTLPVMMERMDEMRLAADEGGLSEQQSTIVLFARKSTECAAALAEYLAGTKVRASVDGLGSGVNPTYASAAVFRAAAGLDLKPLVEDQINANERLVARLEQECKQVQAPEADTATTKVPYRCVPHVLAVDALPKLKSALSLLKEGA